MLANWIKQTTTTTGPGALTLAAVANFPTFNDVVGLQRRAGYTIIDDATGRPVEAGIGYLSDATTFVREKVTATYTGGVYDDTAPAAVNLGAGTYRVICSSTADAIMGASKGPNRALANIQRMVMSQHATHHNASSNAIVLAANRMIFVPFWLTTTIDLDAIACRCGTGGAASSVRMGLYDIASDGHPNKLLAETAALSSVTGGVDLIGTVTPIRLQPGWYMVAIVSNGTPNIGRSDAGGQLPSFLGSGSSNILITYGSFTMDHVFGPLPSGAVSSNVTINPSSSASPAIALRAA